MRKFLANLTLAALFASSALGAFGACAKEIELTWSDFASSAQGYVYDMYTLDLPTVTDGDGKPLKVKTVVTDSEGNIVDSAGGFFVIRNTSAYTVTYTVDCNGKTYSKTMTITGIEKAKYSLAAVPLYGVGETVNLVDKVSASVEGEIAFSVKLGSEKIEVKNGGFMPQKTGVYNVTAKIAGQPEYKFSVTVVDKTIYSRPNALVWDGADETGFSVKLKHMNFSKKHWQTGEDLDPNNLTDELEETSAAEISFDETEKFDAQSNGSVKYTIHYPKGSKSFDSTVYFTPAFSLDYYKSLKLQGYNQIAIRARFDITNSNLQCGLFPFAFSQSQSNMSMVNANGVKKDFRDMAIWWQTGWSNDPFAKEEWAEWLVPIDKFITDYKSAEMPLAMLRTYTNLNADKTAIIDNYFDFDMYIDNVYAVKAFECESAGETYYAETGETLDLISASGAKTDADIDDLIISATKNGAPLAAESPNVTFDGAAADYSFAMRARNRYGVVNQEVTTFKKWTEINAEKAAAGKKLYDLFSDSAESIVTEVYKNGYKIAAEENYVLEDNAWYLITRSSPDYKGVQKAQFTIGTPNADEINAILATGADFAEFSGGDFYDYNAGRTDGGAHWNISETTDQTYGSAEKSVKVAYEKTLADGSVTSAINGVFSDISLRTAICAEELQTLKSFGFKYITMRLAVKSEDTWLLLGNNVRHRNSAASACEIFVNGEKQAKNYYSAGWTEGKTYRSWVEISFNIDDVLANLENGETFRFRYFSPYGNNAGAEICIDEIRLDKELKKAG